MHATHSNTTAPLQLVGRPTGRNDSPQWQGSGCQQGRQPFAGLPGSWGHFPSPLSVLHWPQEFPACLMSGSCESLGQGLGQGPLSGPDMSLGLAFCPWPGSDWSQGGGVAGLKLWPLGAGLGPAGSGCFLPLTWAQSAWQECAGHGQLHRHTHTRTVSALSRCSKFIPSIPGMFREAVQEVPVWWKGHTETSPSQGRCCMQSC